jgi:hypothetical protein
MASKKNNVATACNDPLRYVREFAPSLTVARASLLPFEDLVLCEVAGPQDGESEEPYFAIKVTDPSYGEGRQVSATVTADRVKIEILEISHDSEGHVVEHTLDHWRSSLEGLWDYLRQLPRPAYSFRLMKNSRRG